MPPLPFVCSNHRHINEFCLSLTSHILSFSYIPHFLNCQETSMALFSKYTKILTTSHHLHYDHRCLSHCHLPLDHGINLPNIFSASTLALLQGILKQGSQSDPLKTKIRSSPFSAQNHSVVPYSIQSQSQNSIRQLVVCEVRRVDNHWSRRSCTLSSW